MSGPSVNYLILFPEETLRLWNHSLNSSDSTVCFLKKPQVVPHVGLFSLQVRRWSQCKRKGKRQREKEGQEKGILLVRVKQIIKKNYIRLHRIKYHSLLKWSKVLLKTEIGE